MKHTAARIATASPRMWHVVDAKNQVLGRLTTQIARLLQGKHKPTFVPDRDVGDYVVVVNARHVALTGTKATTKLYKWHTGWMGGLKTRTAKQMFERSPERIITHAVAGQLPKNVTRNHRLLRLRVYPDAQHPHTTQIAHTAAYAPGYQEVMAPTPYEPKAVSGGGGAYVKDPFKGLSAEEVAALEATLKPLEDDPAAQAQVEANQKAHWDAHEAAREAWWKARVAAVEALEKGQPGQEVQSGKMPELR